MDNNNWTTITNPKRNRKKKPLNQESLPTKASSSSRETAPSETDISTLESTLLSHRHRFKSTTFAQNLHTILTRALQNLQTAKNEPKFDCAVCLALGSLSTENLELAKRSAWQLAAFLEICDALRRDSTDGRGIKMVAQDPRFSETDRRVLGRFGVEVVERPGAGEFVTASCFLYVPFLAPTVLLGEVLKGRDPGIYLGLGPGSMRWSVERLDCADDYAGLVEEFGKGRVVTDLPGDFEFGGVIFEGLSVCWRLIEDEDGDGEG